MEKKRNFSARAFTSLLTAAGFVLAAASGLVGYVVPHGRIAYWTDWTFLGLSKTNWSDLHSMSALLFVCAGILHIYFNWKPLYSYFTNKIGKGLRVRRELVITLAVSVFMVAGSIYRWPPLDYLLNLSETAKGSWVSKDLEPPFGRAELLGLDSFCKKMDIPLEMALKYLEDKKFVVPNISEPLVAIAKRNNVSPVALYSAIRDLQGSQKRTNGSEVFTAQMVEEKFAGSGIGRKTIKDLVASIKVESDELQRRLSKANIRWDEDQTIKQIAENHHLQPIEIVKIILVEGYRPGSQ